MQNLNFERCLENLQKINENQESTISRLRERIKELEQESFRDKEIKRLNEENEKLRLKLRDSYYIPEQQNKKIEEWKEKHMKEKHWDALSNSPLKMGAIGGNFSYEFTPTAIGTLLSCKCCCGEHMSLNDMID